MTDPPIWIKALIAIIFFTLLLWAGTKEESGQHYPQKVEIVNGK